MDKPVTLSVKDWIIRNMSVKMNTHERIIQEVVNHQFTSAYEALQDCESMEFSGWGKFYFNRKKAVFKLQKLRDIKNALENILLDEEITEHKRKSAMLKLSVAIKEIEILKTKLHEL
jgi:hypothetical protein